ncbi:YceD family protein [Roseovarius rhodophyticola]|uniref:DUF177 domain-containing protein n=1 Tax=Roseovarius rhodophyticola TaxID=3080827 RepID=A0ABZ2TJ61_9RHOB|nr:DUF177 domain-containing protein [Roseovarius sp. W115]MDV2928047.1 DUF177 domain-containing protein [Roseovarius sp. W115]
MTEQTDLSAPLRVADLKPNRDIPFVGVPEPDVLARLATELGLISLRKLRFEGVVRPEGKTDWKVDAHLGATVTQPCIVTLDPVTTRIEEDASWHLMKNWQAQETEGEEIEMPQDDTRAPLSDEIDLMALMQEVLALALPPYPRSTNAQAEDTRVAPPGVAPLTDEEIKPFAGLSELKKRMEGDG